jgi:hypothetical protein
MMIRALAFFAVFAVVALAFKPSWKTVIGNVNKATAAVALTGMFSAGFVQPVHAVDVPVKSFALDKFLFNPTATFDPLQKVSFPDGSPSTFTVTFE